MKSGQYLMGFLVAGLMAACAKPPTVEMGDAEMAVNAAAQAGAAEFAPNEFAQAQNALADAKAKMDSKDYKGALGAALDTKAKAEIAQGAVSAGKAAAKAAAEEAVKSVEAKLKDIKAQAGKMRGAAATSLKSSIKAIETEWTAVLEDNAKGNFLKVRSASSSILAKVEELAHKAMSSMKPAGAKHGKK